MVVWGSQAGTEVSKNLGLRLGARGGGASTGAPLLLFGLWKETGGWPRRKKG